jgi:tetratricopeptide (TPR) repeat protein
MATTATTALAETYFRRAIALRPQLPTPYHNLGRVLELQGRLTEAEAPLKEFLRLSPYVAEAPGRLGMVYVAQQRYDEAIPLLRRALAMEPSYAAVRGDLVQALRKYADALRREGRNALAQELEREAAQLQAGSP